MSQSYTEGMKENISDPCTLKYIGRFAPSPTGPLHFGSLVTAIASYLDAKANNGLWLVRIDDIDPPREPKGSSDKILQQLEEHGLYWDNEVLYQSQRSEAYLSAIKKLEENDVIFSCHCSRKQFQGEAAVHNYPCQSDNPSTLSSLRLRVKDNKLIEFYDLIQGYQNQSIKEHVGDIVLYRKEKLFSYQLAVVVDDAFQGVTNIIRGSDLLSVTPRQIYLQKLLGLRTPVYGHIPVVVTKNGDKLSKQNLNAASLDSQSVQKNLVTAINWLGLIVPDKFLKRNNPDELIKWAIDKWNIDTVPCVMENSTSSKFYKA